MPRTTHEPKELSIPMRRVQQTSKQTGESWSGTGLGNQGMQERGGWEGEMRRCGGEKIRGCLMTNLSRSYHDKRLDHLSIVRNGMLCRSATRQRRGEWQGG